MAETLEHPLPWEQSSSKIMHSKFISVVVLFSEQFPRPESIVFVRFATNLKINLLV